MKRIYPVLIAGVLIILCRGFVFARGNSEQIDFVIANGTGFTITDIEIRPSKKTYPRNDTVFSYENINLSDQKALEVFLSEDMKEFRSFDMAIRYDERGNGTRLKKIKSGEALVLRDIERTSSFLDKINPFSKGAPIPVYSFSVKGKPNTIANVSGAVGTAVVATELVVGGIALTTGVLVVGWPVVIIGAIGAGIFAGFSPFVSNSLVIEEIGVYYNGRIVTE